MWRMYVEGWVVNCCRGGVGVVDGEFVVMFEGVFLMVVEIGF